MRIVLGMAGCLGYELGGGHWTWALQDVMALRQAGCEILCLAAEESSGDHARDESDAQRLVRRLREYFPEIECCVLCNRKGSPQSLSTAQIYGMRRQEFEKWAASSDLLWNLCHMVRKPLLDLFPCKVLVDVDPGYLQLLDLQGDLGIREHDRCMTVGLNVGHETCEVPLLGRHWTTFPPFLFLEFWNQPCDRRPEAPLTSISHWNWDKGVYWKDRRLSTSKRDAYLALIDLPVLSGRRMTLAANLDDPEDKTGDKKLFESHGWTMREAWEVAPTPASYKEFIASSLAEICAPKPIYVDLKTGWVSDRSAGYLASGRPVLMKDTGISRYLPVGLGLLTFATVEEAAERIREMDCDYPRHSRAARAIAEEYLDSRRVVPRMLDA